MDGGGMGQWVGEWVGVSSPWMVENGRIFAPSGALSLESLYLPALFLGNTWTPRSTRAGWSVLLPGRARSEGHLEALGFRKSGRQFSEHNRAQSCPR